MKKSLSLPKINSVESSSFNRHSLTRSSRRKSIFEDKKCCASTRLCWWEPDLEDINDTVDFTQQTSLHGLKFICQPQRHMAERIFWLVSFLASSIIAGWLISNIWIAWVNSPVVVTFNPVETTIDKLPFPAITICNMNKVQKNRAAEYIKDARGPDNQFKSIRARKNVYYLDHVCSASKSFSQKFKFSSSRGEIDPELVEKARIRDGEDEQSDVANFLRVASQKCSDMLPLCLWQDEVVNCSKLFKPIETDFGKCCTFNMIPQTLLSRHLNDSREDPMEISEWLSWDYENDGLLMTNPNAATKTFPRRQSRAGKSSGLSVLLNPDLEQYFCTSSDSQGFRLVKHLPLDVPKVIDYGIAIRPNAEVFIGIRPELTLAEPEIKGFKLEKRNCYFRGEFQLAYFNHYTSSNCLDECLANQTYETCGCVRYYMPRDDTRDLCGPSKFECVEQVRKNSYQTGLKLGCEFCFPSCVELEYFSETTVTPIQKGVNLWIDDKNRTARWATKNVSIVHIYFQSDSTYAKIRKELYGLTDLIANTGGLLGLTLGFSGLSLIELIYFYTLRAWCRTRRKRTIWAIVGIKLHKMWLRAKRRSERNDNNNQSDMDPTNDERIHNNSGSRDNVRRGSKYCDDNYDDNVQNVVVSANMKPQENLFDKNTRWGKFAGFGTEFGAN